MKSHMKKTDFYVCKVCGQGFKYSGTYNYHMKVHMNQKDFVSLMKSIIDSYWILFFSQGLHNLRNAVHSKKRTDISYSQTYQWKTLWVRLHVI